MVNLSSILHYYSRGFAKENLEILIKKHKSIAYENCVTYFSPIIHNSTSPVSVASLLNRIEHA